MEKSHALTLQRTVLEGLVYQKAQIFLWFPVFMGVGIALYFACPVEPPLWVGFGGLFCSALLWGWYRRHAVLQPVFLLAVCLAGGFASATLRTAQVYTPVLQKKMAPVTLCGTIETLEDLPDEKGVRGVLGGVTLEKIPADDTPRKVRLKFRAGQSLAVGQRVCVLAGLNPPAPPSLPSGFDYQRYMFFQGIGAVGFAYKSVEVQAEPNRDAFSVLSVFEGIRYTIAERIGGIMAPRNASVLNALVTGTQLSIPQVDQEAIRDSGLAHMLSISGLHISLVFGFVFFVVRFVLSCIPPFALRHSTKKWSALVAMLVAIFYTLISGMTIPTIRSVLMMGLVFLAILLDRNPFSLRLVAFSMVCIFVVAPESLLSVSFQLSYSAVVALIVFYEALRDKAPWLLQGRGALRRAGLYVLGIAMTSLVATLGTAPFILYHFQQLPLYGFLANVLAIPLFAFVVMPFAILGFFLMPLGWEGPVMGIVGWGISGILWVSHTVAGLEQATFHVQQWPLITLLSFSGVFLICVLLKGVGKWSALLPLVICLYSVVPAPAPDILVSSTGELVALRTATGALAFSSGRKDKFTRENWLKAFGYPLKEFMKWPKEGALEDLQCGAEGCRLERHGVKVAFPKKEDIFQAECVWADIVIVSFYAPRLQACDDKTLLDRRFLKQSGVTALYLGDKIRLETVESYRRARPWVANIQKRQVP